ncbi:restriction endonuclease S subunit [Kordia periserrulae]|uniref:Restriction endonuclease S subunit n=1 Tax=Kordia periserrulae TaxID=701523 RepID=A0A2T6BYK4_9FLAO|nr:restriction endonuclease subunit S [Kordia periserrulae]PTX61116.1 restriction endonuclease S subunit [Kordia periserrulae]
MELVELNKICDLKNGFAFKSKDYVEKSNTLSCRMSSIRPGGNFDLDHNKRFLPDNFSEIYSDYLLKDGDIVIAMTDLAGDPKILGVPTIVKTEGKFLLQNQRVGKLIIKNEDRVFIPFLKYALNRPENKSYYKKFAGGGLQINVGKKEILNNKIPLPNLATQKRIANILDEADKLCQLNKKIIEKYDTLTQSLFLEMFGDPIENQKNWKVNRLKEISIKILSGNTPKGGSKVYVKNGITFFRSQNIWRNRIELDDVVYISQDIHNNMQKSSLKNGDILMTKTGRINTENSSLGRAAMFMGKDNSANINGHVYLIRLKENIINEFVLFILTTYKYREYIRSVCVGGIDKRQINKTHLEEFPIISPPLKLQNEFAKRIQIIAQQKQQAQEALQKSEDLFNSLLQKAFKGELV